MTVRAASLFSVFALVTLAGCGGASQSNRTPVDPRGVAITPVDRRPPEGTLTEVVAPPAPARIDLPRREPVAAVVDTPRVVHRAEPPAPARATPTTPPARVTPPPATPAAPSPAPSTTSPPASNDYLVKPARVGGVVLVRALVDTEGRVRATRIARSIPELDSAAVQCVRQWRFKPGTSGGVAIATWAEVPVRFLLQ